MLRTGGPLSSRSFSVLSFVVFALAVTVGLLWPQPTRVVFLSVGQGDCAMFQHDGATILIDSGPLKRNFDAGEKIVVPKLRRLGVSGVDLILLSHPDIDHIGGTGSILKAYPDATVAVSACFRTNSQLLEQLRKWGRKPDQVKWLGPELSGKVGAFEIRIDCPQTDPDEETNDGSMLVRLKDGAASAVFTGDAPIKIEEAFARAEEWQAEILKAGHHGSRSSTSQEWLDCIHPEYAVLSCGLNNEYHHPHPSVVRRLQENGIKICRTDMDGDVIFDLAGGRFVKEGK